MFNTLRGSAAGAALIAGMMLVNGCSTQAASATTEASKKASANGQTNGVGSSKGGTTTPTPTPTTTTTTTTTPSGTEPVLSPNGTKGEFDVTDNFEPNTFLELGGGTLGAEPDPVGAFRFTCLAGQLSHDDPIVYPGQPGKSHLHQFFGNDGTNANSTYQSLRTTGGSTCTRSTGTSPQRSAYWMPAMLDGAGNAVKPDFAKTYYKALPVGDPACGAAPDATHIGYCVSMPNGLRFIRGYNMDTGAGGPTTTDTSAGSDYWKMGFDCVTTDGNDTSYTGIKHTIADIVATGQCPIGAWLRVFVLFPDCWDGVHLDTADHRSHVAYADGALIDNFKRACPADHPYNIPEIAFGTYFRTDANFEAGKWHLSSDEMVPGTIAGTTLHMDYWEAWSPVIKNLWETYCINARMSCSAGQIGQGQEVKGMQQVGPFPNHVLVPLSSIP